MKHFERYQFCVIFTTSMRNIQYQKMFERALMKMIQLHGFGIKI